ncbi:MULTISPECIES: DUF2057 family protein [Vibrio]|nr:MULTISPECIES: DUF2057 family protein [Vibrio]ATC57187.1 DUF2057 domain-containing protein [Vibrio anguillarum]MBF4251875.1 DUF2057 domain-containing protein [Vibrio anguillarum]MBF4387729.1 DUF2057 domain-containing protein [Vibrio anguillarum]MBF4402210.1 DUF2057 domain-containing protein [Vibrio anguillarum]NAX19148.1 DUF2057 domain-containing protein [Vibrio sp. V22_P2S10T140]
MFIYRLLSFLCIALITAPTLSATLSTDSSITLLVVNLEKVTESPQALPDGLNQLVVQYKGRIRDGAKREAISSIPYVITLMTKPDDHLHIKFVAKDLSDYQQRLQHGDDLFELTVNDLPSVAIIDILPGKKGFLPYGDPVSLLHDYNQQNGVMVDSGKVRALKQELAEVEEQADPIQGSESEAILQLKLWYGRATEQDRKIFQQWLGQK